MRLRIITIFVVLYVKTLDVNAQLGRSCQTPNGESATCKSIYDCQTLFSVIRTRDQNQIRFLRQSQCGYGSTVLVCCGKKNNFDFEDDQPGTPSTRTPEDRPTPQRDLIPDRSSCGVQFTERILNGEETVPDEFPWMALLEYVGGTGERRFSCGGTIISKRYILTAAHCVTGEILRKVGRLTNVRLGEWNTDTLVDCVENAGIQICNNAPEDIGVEETIFHPNYDNNLADRYDDIALIRLKKDIKYSAYIRPICLPLSSESSTLGEKLYVAGWGKTERANRSPVKLKLEVPIAERSHCVSSFRRASISLKDTQLCAGGVKGKDSCTGDSGGPLMRTTKNDTSQWYIEGIVSFGAGCGTEGWPGIYTRVSKYLEWIRNTIKS